jgi:hypothetical protein
VVNPKWVVKPWEITDELRKRVPSFVFIDDFLGTGTQFDQLIQAERLIGLLETHYVMYAPFAAHEEGIKFLRRTYSKLRVVACEVLDKRHGLYLKKAADAKSQDSKQAATARSARADGQLYAWMRAFHSAARLKTDAKVLLDLANRIKKTRRP